MGGEAFELSAAQAEALARPAGIRRNDVWLPAGELRAETLGAALRRAVAELEILRTGFTVPPGGLDQVQVIAGADDGVCALLSAELTGERQDILHLAAPATIADHRSLHLLAERLAAPPADGDEPLQYVDFAAWAAEQLADDTPDARVARAFWAPAEDVGAAPGGAALEAAVLSDLPVATDEQWLLAWLLVLARQQLIDPAHTALLLTVAGRPLPELATAVGPYARRLAVPFALDLAAAPAEAGSRVASTLEQAERHAVFGRPRPVPAAFSAFPAAAGDADFHRDAPVELRLVGEPRRLGVACRTDLPVSAERLARQVVAAVRGLLAGPAASLAAVPLSDAEELAELARAGTGPAAPVAAAATIVHAFAARAAETPDLVAVDDGAEQLSFAELAAATDRLAAALGAPAGADDAVLGITVDRSVHTVVLLLGVWKSGRAYVPVDPGAPAGRLADLLAGAGCRRLLAARDVPVIDGVHTTVLAELLDRGGAALPPPPADDAPAYVLPTSGSTGTPKAVVVTHANVLAYTMAITERLNLLPGQRYGALTRLTTDLAYTMLLPALAAGSTLRLFSDDEVGDLAQLGAAIRDEHVDAVKLTPSLLRALLAGGDAPLPVPLLVFGGEALHGELVAAARAAGAGRIVNHYGPTETTVGAVAYDVPPQFPPDAPVPIGSPLPGVRVHVLDENGAPVPWGVVGELAIAGPGVAAGYRGDVAAAAAFAAEPGATGARMYRTGDLVRVDRTGRLLFLGRDDGQVKVRGYRVELGEIEHALRQAPGIVDAAVIVDPHDATSGRLVGYVTGEATAGGVEPDGVLAALAERLPAHMVPARLIPLPELPRTASGKIDRRALPDPEQYRPAAAEPTPPADEVEAALLEIWADVLQLSRLGTTDDFFQVGGHSLLATRIMARSRAHFGVDLPLHLIFTHSTVQAMAAEVRTRRDELTAASSEPDPEDLAAVLAQLDSMTEEEARALLARDDQVPPS